MNALSLVQGCIMMHLLIGHLRKEDPSAQKASRSLDREAFESPEIQKDILYILFSSYVFLNFLKRTQIANCCKSV